MTLSELKARTLTEGISVDWDSFDDAVDPDKYRFETKTVVSERHAVDVDRKKIPSELLLTDGRRTNVIKTLVVEGAPLELYLEDSQLRFREYDVEVSLVPRNPADNVKTVNVSQVGVDKLSVIPFSGCDFWREANQCKFCGGAPSREWKGMKELSIYDDVVAVWKKNKDNFLKSYRSRVDQYLEKWAGPHLHFMVMSNWVGSQDAQFRVALDTLKEFKDVASESDSYLINLPPKNRALVDETHDTGVKCIQYNIEVWGEHDFKDIVPGKSKYYGFNGFIEALGYAVSVFGEGNVRTNLVLGAQDVERTKQGAQELASMGVVPSYTVFFPRPRSSWRKEATLDHEEVLEFAGWQGDLLKSHNYTPYACELSSRSSLENEAVRGWI